MIASETDLYACGYKVYIPSPRSRPGSRLKPQTSPTAGLTKETPYKPTKQLSPLNSHVRELGKTLEFTEDVVTEVSPHLVSYSRSKRAAKSLFKPDNLGLTTHSKPKHTSIGRHDCRGEPKRHLPCHLVSSTNHHAYTSSAHGTDAFIPKQDPLYSDTQTEPQCGTINTGLYMAPSTKSVLWEDEVLGKVSSYTARRLTGKPSTLSIDDHPPTRRKTSFVKNASTSFFSNGFSDSDSDQLLSPPPRDYLSEYRDGARPVHQKMADRTKLMLDSGAKFDSIVQDLFPYSPSEWCGGGEGGESVSRVNNVRGYRKWLDFPQPTQTAEDLHWQCRDISAPTETEPSDLSLTTSQPSCQDFVNKEFFEIMREWCGKWQIHLQPKDIADRDTILTDIHNLCDTMRMIAVASIALLAERQALSQHTSNLSLKNSTLSRDEMVGVDEEMVEALKARLEDTAEHVRVPSAITLYCISKQNKAAEDVLLSAVGGASHVESWASVQCLSRGGVATLAIVEELLTRLHDQSQTTVRKASQLLAFLSSKTGLVHCLLSERLNSSGWLERLAACQMFPKLHGGINKDVCHKLVHLAWNDWSPEVRSGASQALGKTGHGKMVHDEIGRRLTDESETVRLDALKKLQSLKLMTTQLLSPYLSCFSDTHTSIRIQAIEMASALKLTHPKVQEALLSLLIHDHSWKVKVATLRAMAECGQRDEALVTQLVWVIRFEKLGRVRAEGCRTIARLGLRDDDKVVKTLKDLLIVEEDPVVKSEVSRTLEELGCSGATEDDMLEKIRSEVKRLGTQETITAEVIGYDRSNTTQRVIKGSDKPVLTTRDILNYAGTRRQRSLVTHPSPITPTSQQSSSIPSPQQRNSNNKAHPKLNSNTTNSTVESPTSEPPIEHEPGTDTVCSAPGSEDNTQTEGSKDNRTDCRPSDASGKGKRDRVWTPDREMIDGHLDKIKNSLRTACS